MGAFDHLIPKSADAPTAGAGRFDHLVPGGGGAPATGGGVQDWEPSGQPRARSGAEDAFDWAKTRVLKAGAGLAGMPTDLQKIGNAGMKNLLSMIIGPGRATEPMPTAIPGSEEINNFLFDTLGIRKKGQTTPVGKAVDVGIESGLQALVNPSTFSRTILPLFVGGTAQDLAGQAAEGSKWEPIVRLATGVLSGGLTAAAQNAAGNAAKGVTNVLFANARDREGQAARVLGRALENDKVTIPELRAAQQALGPQAALVDVGGENVKGVLRGSIAAPGPARTTVSNFFTDRARGEGARTSDALNDKITPNANLGFTVEQLKEGRSQAARQAYTKAGVPQDRADFKNADQLMMTDDLLDLFKKSRDVQAAVTQARGLPELSDAPVNSMAMLDRVYKYVGDKSQAAKQAGEGVRAGDLNSIRTRLAAGIAAENPAYGEALRTFSEPSKLIDAAQRGREWFSKNVAPLDAGAEYAAMSPAEKFSATVGIRDWLRTKAGNSDRGSAAERIWAGGNNRERLRSILGEADFKALESRIEAERTYAKTAREVTQGSRTVPMSYEVAENAGDTGNALLKMMRGRFGEALLEKLGDTVGAGYGRLADGRTSAINDVLAQWLTETDPKKVGLVNALAERARLDAAQTAAGRRSALVTGLVLPGASGAVR